MAIWWSSIIFNEIKIQGAYVVTPEPFPDERGFFAEIFNNNVFEEHDLGFQVAQCNISYNKYQGTIRGLHYQIPPYEEVKLVHCVRGRVLDVIVDLRADSPTYCQWTSTVLSQLNQIQVYVPIGCAHGYQTLEDDTEVMYIVSEFYHPECARGVRWNDPLFQIEWSVTDNIVINSRDANYPDFS